MSESVYAAVDIGATGIKLISAAFNKEKLIVRDQFSFRNQTIVRGDREYADIGYMLKVIKTGLKLFKKHGECISLGIDTYGNGYGILDSNGDLIQEPHYYRDCRIDKIIDFAHEHFTDWELYESFGNFPVKTRSLFHLYQDYLEQSNGVRQGKYLLPLSNLLEYLITGEKSTERTIASVSYFLDRKGEDWNFPVLKKLGVPTEMFGSLVEPGYVKGVVSDNFIPDENCKKIPVSTIVGHDTEAALLAAPRLDEKKVFVSLGTSFIFGTRVSLPVITEKSYKSRFKNIRGAFGMYSLCKDFPGFWILEQLMVHWRKSRPDLDYDMICQAAEAAGYGSAFINVGDNRFRVSKDNIMKVISDYCIETGQKPVEGIGEVSRCLFESYALYLHWNLKQLEAITGVVYNGLAAINGGVRNKFFMQMLADVLGIPVYAGSPVASACGNLLMQLYAKGEVRSLGEIQEINLNSWSPDIFESRESDYWQQCFYNLKRKGIFMEEE